MQITESGHQNGDSDFDSTGESTRNITVQRRTASTIQQVKDAVVYMLRFTSQSFALKEHIEAELRAHIGVLRSNSSAKLILAPPLLPEPGSVEPDVESTARICDLTNIQLKNEHAMELNDVITLVNGVQDSIGRLVVVDKLRDRRGVVLAITVKYQGYTNGYSGEPTIM